MNYRMFKRLITVIMVAAALTVVVATFQSCNPDEPTVTPVTPEPEPDKPGKGVFSVTPASPQVGLTGGVISVSFVTLDTWSCSTSSSWITITSAANGGAGDNSITLSCAANDMQRSAEIKIKVKGYAETLLCNVLQAPAQVTSGTSVNHWIADIMSQKYLWNSAFNNIKNTLDLNLAYDEYLGAALKAVRVNNEDGYTDENNTRYFYTNISRYVKSQSAPAVFRSSATRAESMSDGYGIAYLLVGRMANSANYTLVVCSVYPGSPADKAGLKRGCYITKLNGAPLTDANVVDLFYEFLAYQPYYSGRTMNLSIKTPDLTNQSYVDSEITLAPASFDANPILYADVYSLKDGSHNIGYLSLATFDLYHDEELIEQFKVFKSKGVTELILDLRYNPGGYVYSSALLATAVTGAQKQGQVYSHMQYNADRTATGEAGYFYIGKDPSMQVYPLIEKALEGALNLNRLYVITTDNTASASELVINGLRGLDIEVLTVGTTSQGKNTGMEVMMSESADFSNYNFGNFGYIFEPISFYNLNAKGFSDYHSGFEPTFEINESNYTIFDWKDFANNDVLMMSAVTHIATGAWPTLQKQTAMRVPTADRLYVPDGFRLRGEAKVFANTVTE